MRAALDSQLLTDMADGGITTGTLITAATGIAAADGDTPRPDRAAPSGEGASEATTEAGVEALQWGGGTRALFLDAVPPAETAPHSRSGDCAALRHAGMIAGVLLPGNTVAVRPISGGYPPCHEAAVMTTVVAAALVTV